LDQFKGIQPGEPTQNGDPFTICPLSTDFVHDVSPDSVSTYAEAVIPVEPTNISLLLLPHRDLHWVALPKWFRIFISLMVGLTTLDLVYIFFSDPRNVGLLPIALIPTFCGMFAAVYYSRATPLPIRFYLWAALCGGSVGTLFSGILNTTAAVFLGETTVITLVAPFFEELIKLLVVLAVIIVCSSVSAVVVNRFTATATGIAVGAGFTLVEDITYLSKGLTFSEAATIAVGRSLLSPFVHMVCTALVGYGVGLIIEQRRQGSFKLVTLFFFAFVLHSLWNVTSQVSFELSLALSFLFTCSFLLAVQLVSRENLCVLKQQVPPPLLSCIPDGVRTLSALEVFLIQDEKHLRRLQREHPPVRNELADLRLSVSELLNTLNHPFAPATPTAEGYTEFASVSPEYQLTFEREAALSKARTNLFDHSYGKVFTQNFNDQRDTSSE